MSARLLRRRLVLSSDLREKSVRRPALGPTRPTPPPSAVVSSTAGLRDQWQRRLRGGRRRLWRKCVGGEEVPSARRDELQEPLLQDPVAPARARIVQELTVDPIGVQMHLVEEVLPDGGGLGGQVVVVGPPAELRQLHVRDARQESDSSRAAESPSRERPRPPGPLRSLRAAP
eukprot:CAMPEP_0172591428 /NCGR_PEP_ID=MMETSP1068-20121228/10210_1 /TAXON_ID=35684 /ORGANISM="Pseudopedinella elastica, Strain CCMP716" /LENGTH=172 /DNA_ID=CAMNT_0013387883 /DNA_START=130 /DNA_END=646 /DNA_ORIENTATION=+